MLASILLEAKNWKPPNLQTHIFWLSQQRQGLPQFVQSTSKSLYKDWSNDAKLNLFFSIIVVV